jgi:YidC/Oxa1 family membrane protein insertase
MGIGEIFNILLVNPTINVLLLFLFLFSTWSIPGAFGWAVVSLTVAIRILFQPFYAKQMQTASQMESLRPELARIQEKYKNDKQKLQQEQLKLYQKKGINPASGCLVGLIQLPIFIALYQVLQLFLEKDVPEVVKHVNEVVYAGFLRISSIDPWFLGLNLAASPSQFQEFGAHYLLIPLVTAGLQYYQITYATPQANKSSSKTKKSGPDDMQTAMAKQMRIMFPIMIGYFSYILPVGLAVYWNVFSLFSIYHGKKLTWKNKKLSKN